MHFTARSFTRVGTVKRRTQTGLKTARWSQQRQTHYAKPVGRSVQVVRTKNLSNRPQRHKRGDASFLPTKGLPVIEFGRRLRPNQLGDKIDFPPYALNARYLSSRHQQNMSGDNSSVSTEVQPDTKSGEENSAHSDGWTDFSFNLLNKQPTVQGPQGSNLNVEDFTTYVRNLHELINDLATEKGDRTLNFTELGSGSLPALLKIPPIKGNKDFNGILMWVLLTVYVQECNKPEVVALSEKVVAKCKIIIQSGVNPSFKKQQTEGPSLMVMIVSFYRATGNLELFENILKDQSRPFGDFLYAHTLIMEKLESFIEYCIWDDLHRPVRMLFDMRPDLIGTLMHRSSASSRVEYGNNMLHLACHGGTSDMILMLLHYSEVQHMATRKDYYGHTLLYHCLTRFNIGAIPDLLKDAFREAGITLTQEEQEALDKQAQEEQEALDIQRKSI